MRGLYFDEIAIGDTVESGGATVTESQILDFAQRYDPQWFHMDVEAAREGPYGGLIASGFQTLALSFRLFADTGALHGAGLGGHGLDALKWLKPVRPGDTLKVTMTITDKRESRSAADRGYIACRFETVNQHGETVLTFTSSNIVKRRP